MTQKNTSFIKQIFGYSLSTWVNCIISVVSVPIVTNLFLPEELGKINLFISYVNIFLAFAYFGMDQSYTRFHHEPLGKNDEKSILSLCMIISLIATAIISVGIVLNKNNISTGILGYSSNSLIFFMILSIVAQLILRYLNLSSRMRNNIALYSVQAITLTILMKLSFVLAALWGSTATLAISIIAIFSVVSAIIFTLLKCRRVFSIHIDFSPLALKEVLKHGIPLIPSSALALLNSNLPQILMRRFLDFYSIGIFSNAATVAGIITVIQGGLSTFWVPFVYENYKTKNALIIKMHHTISGLLLCAGIGICLLQPIIYTLLVGNEYASSSRIFPFLLITPICYTISETLGMGIRLANKTYWNILVYAITLGTNIGMCWALLPIMGVLGGAIASATSAIVMLITKGFVGEKYYRCTGGNLRLIFGTGILVLTSAVNYMMYDSIYKYLLFFFALLGVVGIYRKEMKLLYIYSIKMIKNYVDKKNGK